MLKDVMRPAVTMIAKASWVITVTIEYALYTQALEVFVRTQAAKRLAEQAARFTLAQRATAQ